MCYLLFADKVAFCGFKEMCINFLPTYRLLRQTWTDKNERVYNHEVSLYHLPFLFPMLMFSLEISSTKLV